MLNFQTAKDKLPNDALNVLRLVNYDNFKAFVEDLANTSKKPPVEVVKTMLSSQHRPAVEANFPYIHEALNELAAQVGN